MSAPAGNGGMTPGDRRQLAAIIKKRAEHARQQVKARQAELVAQAEGQLSKEWGAEDLLFAEVTRQARQAASEADERVHQICQEHGIPDEFRPSISFGWSYRGENARKDRRSELREAARTAARASAEAAKTAIDSRELDVLERIITGGLESGEARAFLDTIPTPAQIMPVIDVKALGAGSHE